MFPTGPETPFRDNQNRRYLRGLFKEWDKATAIYTLRDQDHEGYPSLYKLYLATGDLTEYEFANKFLESWEHWTMLTKCSWFQEYLVRWRTELELKLKAEALRLLVQEAKGTGKNAYNAKRFIIDKGWLDKTTEPSRRGRPSKDEVNKALAEEVFNSDQIKEDMKRLGLN